MKLIFCPYCQDIVKLLIEEIRFCRCGKVFGKYLEDGIRAEISEDAIAIGINNSSFVRAIKMRESFIPTLRDFDAWIMIPMHGIDNLEYMKRMNTCPLIRKKK